MRYALAITALCLCSPALAQQVTFGSATGLEIPDHDVDRYCGKSDGTPTKAYCVRSEQASYENLKFLWPEASEQVKKRSLTYAKQYYETSQYYYALAGYMRSFMRDEQIAQDSATPPRFQR